MNSKGISLYDKIGKGYNRFWHFTGRYRVVKGSRASKKSKTTALWFITKLMKHPEANALVIRKVHRTVKDSCYKELKWAANTLGVADQWDFTLSPLEATFKPTGQKIYFRGLDDPLKVTSITVEVGVLCWLWIEEAYEIMKEEDFDMLDESIRGVMPYGLFKQVTFTLNPWNERHWIKRRFFDVDDPDILAMTTNYLCNEWLDEADLRLFENMKIKNPRRYQVAGLGNWGVVEGLIYENWEENRFALDDVLKIPGIQTAFGLDFGYTNDPSALFCGLIDKKDKKLYVFNEMYEKGLSNEALYKQIERMGYRKEEITADCAEPKSIDRLKILGIPRIKPAMKGKDSINNGIDFLQDFKIIIHPDCVNFLTEISNYTWDQDKFGNTINKPIDDFNHLMDAMRYAVEKYIGLQRGWAISNKSF